MNDVILFIIIIIIMLNIFNEEERVEEMYRVKRK